MKFDNYSLYYYHSQPETLIGFKEFVREDMVRALNFCEYMGKRIKVVEDALIECGDTWLMFYYTQDIIKGRWPEAEKYISMNEDICADYINQLFKPSDEDASILLMKPSYAYIFAKRILDRRWRKGENLIMTDPEYIFYYAIDVIHNRWSDAEPFIKQDPAWAYQYAKYIIRDRWPDAEPFIKQNTKWWDRYKKDFGIKE